MKTREGKNWMEKVWERFRPHLPAGLMLCLLGLFFSLQAEQFFSLRNFINIMTHTAAM